MYVTIQMNDATYAKLLNNTCRIQGSIGLVSPTEGNFNAHRRCRNKRAMQYMKLPHGRVTISTEQVRMHLCIGLDESIIPARAIDTESHLASNYVDLMEELQ